MQTVCKSFVVMITFAEFMNWTRDNSDACFNVLSMIFPYLGEDNKHVIYILSDIMSKSWTKRASGRNVEAETRHSGSKAAK